MLNLNKAQIETFEKFYNLLIEANKKFNLTRITEKDEVYTRHFLDSLAVSKWIPTNAKIIDIGTGAGFPSVPLAITRPDIEITAIDSSLKRVNFVNSAIDELNLNNLKCIHERAEMLAHNSDFREKFDIAISRAVANLAILAEYHLPFLRIEGLSISMKSINANEEIETAKDNIDILGGDIPEKHLYQIPNTDITNMAVTIKKKTKTPEEFPRKAKKVGTPINL